MDEHIEILSGFAFKSKEFNKDGNGVPVVRIRDVGKDRSSTYYSGEYSDNYLLKNGDLLIGMDGDFRLAVWKGGKALLNQRVCKITVNDKTLNREYMYYMLPKELKRIEDKTSFATVKHLSVKKIKGIKIPLPPLPQQKKIAAILDAADAYRQKTKALIAKYEELTKSLFLDMFGDPVTNNKGLGKVKLGNLGKWQSGGTPSRRELKYFEGDIPWLSSGELNQMYTHDSKEHITSLAIQESNSKLIKKGSILLGMYDTAALKSTINTEIVSCNQAIAYCKLNEELVDTSFVYHIIQIGKEHYKRLQRGVRQKNLNLTMVKEIEILYPPLVLQKQFAERTKVIEAQKIEAQICLKKSEDLFNSLLQKAFKGELI